ncbi:unnamed protein product [Lactuca virosa]|uniref:Uncharacterized protein n=1 Tax=Lactuca virosa TaxID=75947 RepID=A0AAU9NXG4_9ASTR|nr:unnamed protein product [Lactuca virosa]
MDFPLGCFNPSIINLQNLQSYLAPNLAPKFDPLNSQSSCPWPTLPFTFTATLIQLLKREDIEDGTVMSRLAFPLLCLLLHGYGSESMKQDTLRSIVMGPKLKEIDEVIKLIHSKCYLESRKWLLVIIICKKMLLRLLQAQTIHSTFESISY